MTNMENLSTVTSPNENKPFPPPKITENLYFTTFSDRDHMETIDFSGFPTKNIQILSDLVTT